MSETKPPTVRTAEDRSATIAVTVFPILVLAAAASPLPGVAVLPLTWATLVLAALRRPERA